MAEVAFLHAVRDFLAGPAGVTPALESVGFAAPESGDDFPMAALALGEVARVDVGLGGGASEVSDGSLEVVSTIDLANPVLEGTDGFTLLDGSRTELTLPHGGLIREDAVESAIGPSDLTISVDGAARTLVGASPGATEFAADPQTGQLSFGAALPASGDLVATYYLGIWERATTLITGTLELGIWDTNAARLTSVSDQAIRALMASSEGALPGLQKIRLTQIGEIGEAQPAAPNARRRLARFGFEFEHIVDTPLSSGGIISRVATTSRLAAFTRDPGTGAFVETVEIETDE